MMWISVKDRLPENKDLVLLSSQGCIDANVYIYVIDFNEDGLIELTFQSMSGNDVVCYPHKELLWCIVPSLEKGE